MMRRRTRLTGFLRSSCVLLLLQSSRRARRPSRTVATKSRPRARSISARLRFRSTSPPAQMDLPIDTVLAHVQSAASAVTTYFGEFPVNRARILIIPVPDKGGGILQGTTWGDMSGFQGFTRIRIGQHIHHRRPGRRLDHNPRNGAHGVPLPASTISTGWKRVWPPTLSPSRALRPAS